MGKYWVIWLMQIAAGWAVFGGGAQAQEPEQLGLRQQSHEAMRKATRYMMEEVAVHGGGYVWSYLPDLSRRWGEMEAYPTMMWLQGSGTPAMANAFLDAYAATGDELFYEAAERAVNALIWGQLECGGWNYIVDFAGEQSLKQWYETIGRNGWRLEEFQHYYGNATFDDNVSTNAAKLLLRIYLVKLDPKFRPALDRAIEFVLKSQYPAGGWPQRYPLRHDFKKNGNPDYTHYYTFNDNVTWSNVRFLIDCYQMLGDARFLDPIYRGMNFYLITQQGPEQPGWALQYDMQLEPAGGRSYEPKALVTSTTAGHVGVLMECYRLTGQRKFLARIPEALDWLETTRLDDDGGAGRGERFARFVELDTGRPLFTHRRGSNSANGEYYVDYNPEGTLSHYRSETSLDVERLRQRYETLATMPREEATSGSPLLEAWSAESGAVGESSSVSGMRTPQEALVGRRDGAGGSGRRLDRPENLEQQVERVLESMTEKGTWLTARGATTNPYRGEGTPAGAGSTEFASQNVGDEYDTSPYSDRSGQEYLSTAAFIRNLGILGRYVAVTGNNPEEDEGE